MGSEMCIRDSQYRGILYPYIINRANHVAIFFGVSVTSIVYTTQLLLVFCSSCFLSWAVLWSKGEANERYKRKLPVVLIGIVVLSNPLVAHFSLTVLTDSIASSLTMLFLGCLLMVYQGVKKQIYFLMMAILCLFFMSLLRVDKLYYGVVVFVVFTILLYFKRYDIKILLFSVLLLLITILGVAIVNRYTQVYNIERPSLNVSNLAFNRIVWPRMSDAHEYFSEELKKKITIEDAKKFDEHNNNVYPFLTKTLKEDNGDKVISDITFSALKHFPIRIAARIAFDFTKYSLPNIAFPLEVYGVIPESTATSWTLSRMGMHKPLLTNVYMLLGAMSTCGMLLYMFFAFNRMKKSGISYIRKPAVAYIIFFAIVVNSALFALEAGMDAHIRYALPSYTIILTLISTFFMGRIFYGK